ncbi:MAG TPA: OmpA family protein [Bryobacteraceae bacterium]|nr:OmpA family protein [Bryobacteraceae bacterium]
MKAFLATTCIVTGALLAGGCATKKYVRNTAAPIQAKVDQVGEQTTQNGNQIQDTNKKVTDVDQRAQNGISAANEKAGTADQHAADAMNHANDAMTHANDAMTTAKTADQKSDQNTQGLNSLRGVISNIDDYKLQSTVTVPFTLNKYSLTKENKSDLDKLAQDVQADKRFIISVEGFTDKSGGSQYNEVLSKKRADAVVEYLVAKHDIPIYRIHMIGLGDEKPVDEAHNRAARAKNRRVEVKVFSADQVTAGITTSTSADRTTTGQGHQQ